MARRNYSMTEDVIARFREDGRGDGLGKDYKPWLTIQDVPSRGRSHRLLGLKTGRIHHLLSDLEVGLFYQLDWQENVVDIREQFPLDRERTQAIAASGGIRHPADPSSRTPLVMTSDFLVDAVINGRMQCFAYAVKPASELVKPRVAEKLDIERAYWVAEGVVWGIVTEDVLNRQLISNIRWVHNYGDIDQVTQPYSGYLAEKAELLMDEFTTHPVGTVGQMTDALDLRLSMRPGTALSLLRHLIARRKVLCDMDVALNEALLAQCLTVAIPALRQWRAE